MIIAHAAAAASAIVCVCVRESPGTLSRTRRARRHCSGERSDDDGRVRLCKEKKTKNDTTRVTRQADSNGGRSNSTTDGDSR